MSTQVRVGFIGTSWYGFISPNFYDGWQAQRVIEAALESEREGRWISLTAGK